MKYCVILCLLIVAVCTPLLSAQDVPSQSDDEAAVRAAGEAYIKAFNAGDATKLATYWSPEAVYLNRVTGQQVVGRQAIAEQFGELFAAEGEETLEVSVESIRFVSPNVAVEQGVAKFLSSQSEPEQTEYSAVYVRREGKWLLDRVTDTSTIKKSNYEHLKDLQWMIGSWVDQDDRVRIVTDCSWTKNQNFITRSFTVSAGDNIDLSGMQIIGWDPVAKQIRSWTFDSDGGFAQGRWSKTGNEWHVHKKGTTADGKTTTAVNQLTVVDNDSFELQSVQRTLDGRLLPNIDEVLVVRQ